MAFAHLHNHTEHSPLDGLGRIKSIAQVAASLGQTAMAITDHKSLAGALKFQRNCLEAGVKPIIGVEFYLAIGDRFERNFEVVPNDDDNASDADEGTEKVKRYMHLTVLARNETGWKNLLALHNKAEDSYWYQPRIDFDLLDQHGEGLIILSGCLGGPVAGPLARAGVLAKAGDAVGAEALRDTARANLDRLIGAVGREHVFLEVMYHGIGAEQRAYREIRTLSAETGIPMVATNDCHYEHAHDAPAHDGFLAVGVKRSLDDPKRFRFNGTADYYIKSEEEMLAVLGNHPNAEVAQSWRDACAMTDHVAFLCDDKVIPDRKMRLPEYPVPEGFDSPSAFLKHLVKEGAVERYGTPLTDEVKDRLRTELGIINDMGFPSYFLIVWDVINWARSDAPIEFDNPDAPRKKPILVGVGRGSAAGSAVSYCLKIVGVDPLENNLLFERFLEPGRQGMPDIDVDFEAGRRREVFAYLAYRWGKDRVAHIGTFGMALSKAAIKDAARILKPSTFDAETLALLAEAREQGDTAKAGALQKRGAETMLSRGAHLLKLGNRLSDLVPSAGEKAYNFAQLDDTSDAAGDAFRTLVQESGDDAAEILRLARAFEGITKTESIHACGFIISPEPLDNIVPMRWQSHDASADPDQPRVICWDGGDCEEIGLLKMDVLGLINLDIASTALDYMEATTGNKLTLEEIPHPSTISDPIVRGAYDLLAAGKTAGVFQMESGGMIKIAQSIAPESLDDISAIVAIFRPGPLKAGMDRSYAARKAGHEPVAYTDFTSDPVETEWIDKVMGATYGMAIYQETIMRLSAVVSGFDATKRSKLRKAMGKKKQEEMDKCFSWWLDGAGQEFRNDDGEVISPVFGDKTAKRLWDFISGAASYLFNASHSAAYGQLAYYTAYLKAGWPVEYGAAILAVADKDEKRLTALRSLRDDGIEVLAPDVNKSLERTAPVDGKILFGLAEIKDVGANGNHIVKERLENGPFSSMFDLMQRVRVPADNATGFSRLSTTVMQGLIEAGALDSFGPRLGLLMVMRAAQKSDVAPLDARWSDVEASTRQRLRLGVSLGTHPLTSLREVLRDYQTPLVDDNGEPCGTKLTPLHLIASKNGASAVTVGVISQWEEKGYSGGRRANFAVESTKTTVQGVIWDRTLTSLRRRGIVPKIGDVVALSGKVNVRTTVLGDDESGTQETVTTKELNIAEMWPIDSGSKPEIALQSNVFDFTTAYHRLRAEAPKPDTTPPGTRGTQAAGDTPVGEAEPAAKAPAIVLPLTRSEENWVAVELSPRTTTLAGYELAGNEALSKKCRKFAIPSGPATAGEVFRCVSAEGKKFFGIVSGGPLTLTELIAVVREADEDDARWALLVSHASQSEALVWHAMTSDTCGASKQDRTELV
ncbi:DNA polymerase III subunit alpha [Arthrobacter sp. MDT1-65]